MPLDANAKPTRTHKWGSAVRSCRCHSCSARRVEKRFHKAREQLIIDIYGLLRIRHGSTPARFTYYGEALQVWDATEKDKKLIEAAKRDNPSKFEDARVTRLLFHNPPPDADERRVPDLTRSNWWKEDE